MCQSDQAGEQSDVNLFSFNELSLFLIKAGVKAQLLMIDPGLLNSKLFKRTSENFERQCSCLALKNRAKL